jgi:hypothetical protein
MTKTTLNEKSIRRAAPDTGQLELWDAYLPGFGLRINAGGTRTYFVMRRVSGHWYAAPSAKRQAWRCALANNLPKENFGRPTPGSG